MLLHEIGGELPEVAVPDHAVAVHEEVGGQPDPAVQGLDRGREIEPDGVIEIVAERIFADRRGRLLDVDREDLQIVAAVRMV